MMNSLTMAEGMLEVVVAVDRTVVVRNECGCLLLYCLWVASVEIFDEIRGIRQMSAGFPCVFFIGVSFPVD